MANYSESPYLSFNDLIDVRTTRITVGNTTFTVESLQSPHAKESLDTKVKKLILNDMERNRKAG